MENAPIKLRFNVTGRGRRFFAASIDIGLNYFLFIMFRLILLRDEVGLITAPTILNNYALNISTAQAPMFLMYDLALPMLFYFIIPYLTRGYTMGGIIMRTKSLVLNGEKLRPSKVFVRFLPFQMSLWLIAIANFAIDINTVQLYPSWFMNDIDAILNVKSIDATFAKHVVNALFSLIPFSVAYSILTDFDSRAYSEKLAGTVAIYTGNKRVASKISVTLTSVVESEEEKAQRLLLEKELEESTPDQTKTRKISLRKSLEDTKVIIRTESEEERRRRKSRQAKNNSSKKTTTKKPTAKKTAPKKVTTKKAVAKPVPKKAATKTSVNKTSKVKK